jgi:hypothetical protein
MMTPQQPKGQQASGKAKVMIAIHILKTSMVDLGLGEDFQAVLDAVKTLTKKFGKTEEDSKQIMPAEIMQAMMKQAGPGPPGGKPPGGAAPAAAAPPAQAA